MKNLIFLCVFAMIYEGSKINNQDMKVWRRHMMAIYGLVIEAPQNESVGNTDRPIPNDGRSLSCPLLYPRSGRYKADQLL